MSEAGMCVGSDLGSIAWTLKRCYSSGHNIEAHTRRSLLQTRYNRVKDTVDRPLHEVLWLNCAAKRCCATRTVLPTGADIWRIATALQIAPTSFLRAIPAHDGDNGDAFVLDSAGTLFHAALARRPLKARATTCIFLLSIGDQAARCGLDGLRPLSCQAFPAGGTPPLLEVADAHACSCRTWTLAEIDRPAAAATLQRQAHERAQYRATVQDWNARVRAAPATTRFAFPDFCSFVLASAPQGAS